MRQDICMNETIEHLNREHWQVENLQTHCYQPCTLNAITTIVLLQHCAFTTKTGKQGAGFLET
jgi:hypothetical protein